MIFFVLVGISVSFHNEVQLQDAKSPSEANNTIITRIILAIQINIFFIIYFSFLGNNNRLAKYEMAQESIGTNIVHNSIIIPTSSLAVI